MGKILIVTGMSGAGKTICLKHLEDFGYYALDNLPVGLLDKFVTFSMQGGLEFKKIALGVDIRHEKDFGELKKLLDLWDESNLAYDLLYLDANDRTLVRRFKETRRDHPLAKILMKGISLEEQIKFERKKISWLKQRASVYISTDDCKIGDLKNKIETIISKKRKFAKLNVSIVSFGYKHGIPIDSDLVFDVRFLPNPYYELKLREKTGFDKKVKNYIAKDGTYENFLKYLYKLIDFLLPQYEKEGKDSIIIAIGCTGGKHRSVTTAIDLYNHINKSKKYITKLDNRDLKNE